MFSASDIKDLRERTGAGMLDCKKALEETEGNMEKAIDWLREKGISKAAKKEARVAAEGICIVKVEGNTAVMVEVNSETDFVAKNKEFTDFVEELAAQILIHNVSTNEEVLKIEDGSETIQDKLIALTAKIGEKISFRRFVRCTKSDDECFGAYMHMGGKIGSLIVLEGGSEEVARDIAMHTAAMNPICLNRDSVPKEMIDRESAVIKEQVMNEGKPADIAEKMVIGRLNKFYKEICLEEQEFIKDSSMNIKEFAKNNQATIKAMYRYQVGEGIEKKEENFASEVMSQINGANK